MGSFRQSQLYLGDMRKVLHTIPAHSVDMVFADLPYGSTQNKWDIIIPFEELWPALLHVGKPNTAYVFTATFPFAALLVASNLTMYRYDMVWIKTISSGQLNVAKQPMRSHENILVFYDKLPVYNEQKTVGTPYSIKRGAVYASETYGEQKPHEKVNDGFRHAKSYIEISNPRIKGGHPTEKPLALMEHLLRMYSNEGDIVLDPTMGRGTTGVAAKRLNRAFIGVELDEIYFYKAKERIENE